VFEENACTLIAMGSDCKSGRLASTSSAGDTRRKNP
jgi:hypothetical protein